MKRKQLRNALASARHAVELGWEYSLRFVQAFLCAYALIFVTVGGLYQVVEHETASLADGSALDLIPPPLTVLLLLAAAVYPVTAALYILFNLRIRFNEVLDIGLRNDWGAVYFPAERRRSGERKLRRYIRRRFHEYYSPWELTLLALLAGLLTFALGSFVTQHVEPPAGFTLAEANTWKVLGTAGLVGGYVGSLALLLRKFRTFDLYPSSYFLATVGVVAGTTVGAAFGATLPSTYVLIGVVAIGFFASTRASFLFTLLRRPLADVIGVTLAPDIETDLDRVIRNTEAIESLNNISVNSLAEFVQAEPIRLYLNLAQQVDVVNGWIDSALLEHHFAGRAAALRAADIHSLTQLIERLGRRQAVTGDPAIDQPVAAVAADLMDSGKLQRALSLLSAKYRPKQQPEPE